MYRVCLSVAGVTIGIESPWPLSAAESLDVFTIPWRTPDVLYRFRAMERRDDLTSVRGQNTALVYSDGNQFYRVVPYGESIGEFLTSRASKELFHIYYPPELDAAPPKEIDYPRAIAWEENFLDFGGFYLHSSCVKLGEKSVVFTAPSGTGKSTQADLWKQHLGAVILNGDRTVVRREQDGWRCYGSPYAGSSNIYKNESAGLGAIIVLRQGPENKLERLSVKETFVCLYQETVQNPWNRDYMARMSDLLWQAIQETPVYKLTCRPDWQAVELVYRAVFGGEKEA